MEEKLIKAKLSYLRIAPRKVRLVADLIRRKEVREAENILLFTQKKAAVPLLKLLKQAVANATNNLQLPEEGLFIKEILVDEGPALKRTLPRSRGRADVIRKKTSHIKIFLSQKGTKEKNKKKK